MVSTYENQSHKIFLTMNFFPNYSSLISFNVDFDVYIIRVFQNVPGWSYYE